MRKPRPRTSEYLSKLSVVGEAGPKVPGWLAISGSILQCASELHYAIPEVTGRLKTVEEEPKTSRSLKVTKMAETPVACLTVYKCALQ